MAILIYHRIILATGVLKGYDQLLNLVLDGAIEHLRDAEDPTVIGDETRNLGNPI